MWYRLYHQDLSPTYHRYPDDAAAFVAALGKINGGVIEAWRGDRLIFRIEPPDTEERGFLLLPQYRRERSNAQNA